MGLIIKSLVLSLPVMARMILPILGIFLASIVVWIVADIITLGYASHVSQPVTAMFIAMVGIRAALGLMGERQHVDWRVLGALSVAFGIALLLAKKALVILAIVIAVLVSEWHLSDIGSLFTLETAEESVSRQFELHLLSITAGLSFLFLVAAPVAMAVPIAAGAHSAGSGARHYGFFEGFAKSFVPLFIVFAVAYFLMFFFSLAAQLYGFITMLYAIIAVLGDPQDFQMIQAENVFRAVVSCLGLLWLHAWTWSASALAFAKFKGKAEAQRVAVKAPSPVDLRALRKARS